tara:strand:- start:119 stop:373 length:255 start_codon:yes stop_codon:yes gene_type:complete
MKKFFKLVLSLYLILFIYLIISYYFSEENAVLINQNRENHNISQQNLYKLPILRNDTDNVIVFNDNFSSENLKKKKRNFWDLIK